MPPPKTVGWRPSYNAPCSALVTALSTYRASEAHQMQVQHGVRKPWAPGGAIQNEVVLMVNLQMLAHTMVHGRALDSTGAVPLLLSVPGGRLGVCSKESLGEHSSGPNETKKGC
eukprot:976280-Pelagomonas_calceolata.AAC.3